MKQAHIRLDETINSRIAIMPGDPKRIDIIAKYLEDVKQLEYNREYRSIIGKYKGENVIAISTGMGGSSVSIAVEELKNIGVKIMMRVGSAGALQNNINIGDLIICEGAVREDGASNTYIDSKYPAVPDYRLLKHCVDIAKENNFEYHTGIVLSHESFYHDEDEEESIKWSKKGIIGSDFETAALFTVGRLRNIYTASILNNVVLWGQDTTESVSSFMGGLDKTAIGEEREIKVALEAMYRFSKEMD